jgi:Zn-dependent protease
MERCPQCGAAVAPGEPVCRQCGALVHRARLEQLSAEALRLEQVNPGLALDMWMQCLRLLPPDSRQYQMIAERIHALQAMLAPRQQRVGGQGQPLDYLPADSASTSPPEPWESILLKTGGSMAVSMWLFARQESWPFAVGFVLLIFVHEMGHVIANWYLGIKQSAPIFLGFLGAVIFLREPPRNARDEAICGISGPVAGTIGALACYAWYAQTHNPLALELSRWAFFLNAFNLLPLPPLDGGRTAAAITPWLWILGVVGMAGFSLLMLVDSWKSGSVSFLSLFIIIYMFRSALPRLQQTLFGGGYRNPYYHVEPPARIAVSVIYFGLFALLIGMLYQTHFI